MGNNICEFIIDDLNKYLGYINNHNKYFKCEYGQVYFYYISKKQLALDVERIQYEVLTKIINNQEYAIKFLKWIADYIADRYQLVFSTYNETLLIGYGNICDFMCLLDIDIKIN